MPSLKTNDLPVINERPSCYYATGQSAVVSTKVSNPEQSIITITLAAVGTGRKRTDSIILRKSWFEPDFNPKNIEEEKELGLWALSLGAKNRRGKVQKYFGGEVAANFDTPKQLADALHDHIEGREYIVVETQSKDAEGQPSQYSNLNIYDEKNPPKKLPDNCLDLRETQKPTGNDVHEPTADTVAPLKKTGTN